MKSNSGINAFCGVLLALGLTAPAAAEADWAYTRWGMTPDQVVAASGGTVKMLPSAQRTRNDYDQWELAAEGRYMDGKLGLTVGFTFDTGKGGLKCVMYNALGADAEALRLALINRYGKPSSESSFAATHTLTWRTPDNIELVIGQNPVAAVVSHCMPEAH